MSVSYDCRKSVYRLENGTAYFKTVIFITEAMLMNVSGDNVLIKIATLLQDAQIIACSHVVAVRKFFCSSFLCLFVLV